MVKNIKLKLYVENIESISDNYVNSLVSAAILDYNDLMYESRVKFVERMIFYVIIGVGTVFQD